MTRTNRQANLASQVLTFSVVLGLAAPAHAYNFTLGEIEGQLDSSLSFGASWGTSKIDKNLVGIRANGVPGVFSVTNNLVVESQIPK